jgi:hypothetical protein
MFKTLFDVKCSFNSWIVTIVFTSLSCCHCAMLQMWLHWWLMECKCDVWVEVWLCILMQVQAACYCECWKHWSTASDDWDIWLVSDSYWRNLSRAVWGSECFLSYPWLSKIFGLLMCDICLKDYQFYFLGGTHASCCLCSKDPYTSSWHIFCVQGWCLACATKSVQYVIWKMN